MISRGFCGLGAACGIAVALILLVSGPSPVAAAEASDVLLVEPTSGNQMPLGKGEPLLHVAFFATWCQNCLDELDVLSDLEDRWGDHGYELVLVAVRSRQSAERLASFAEGRDLPGRLAFDASGGLEQALDATRLPVHVLLDESGAVVGRSESASEIVAQVDERLAQQGRRR